PDEVAELFGDLLDQEEAGERGESEDQRCEVLAQHVTAEDAHGQSRHYIRTSTALQVPFQPIVSRHIGPGVSGKRVGTAPGMARPRSLPLSLPPARADCSVPTRTSGCS